MANGFTFESPLNRLLSITVPQFINQQLNRQENTRRFNEQMKRDADRAAQQQRNFESQQQLQKEELKFNQNMARVQEENSEVSNLIDSLNRVNNIDQRINRLSMLSQADRFSSQSRDKMRLEIKALEDLKDENKNTNDFLLSTGLISDKDSMKLSRFVNNANYSTFANDLYKLNIQNLSEERKRQFEGAKLQYTENGKLIKSLQEQKSSGIADPATRNDIDSQIEKLQVENKNIIDSFSSTADAGNERIAILEEEIAALKNAKPEVNTNLIKELSLLGDDAAENDISQIFAKYGVTDQNEQAEIIVLMNEFEGIFDKQDPQDLSKKERALIERRRKLEQTRQQLDPTGSSSLESLFDFLRSSNFVPMNPFTGERFVR
tara:strand:+ start:37 stop:1167 length:1131 start_codon:yes stop_codon:yes gene_type:complete